MPALKPTRFTGTVIWLGRVTDRDASLRAEALPRADLGFAGIAGESHGGLTRASCSRVSSQYPRGTQIRNTRQLSLLSAEEMTEIAAGMGVAALDPAWLGVSMVIKGIPDFTHLPPSSRLLMPSGASLTVDMENRPCVLPAPVIDHNAPGHGAAFKAAAKGLRGVTAWVEREGPVALGDRVTLHVPDQRAWAHLDAARSGAA